MAISLGQCRTFGCFEHSCQGWGRGFESLRPLQNTKRIQLDMTMATEVAFVVFGLDTTQTPPWTERS
jgi:hypothetical protein